MLVHEPRAFTRRYKKLNIYSLKKVARDILASGPHKFEDSPRRIRVLLHGAYIFDTTSTTLVWEHPWYPNYYLPHSALQNASLTEPAPSDEGYTIYTLTVGAKNSRGAAVLFNKGRLEGLVRLDFKTMDGWFEEDDPIYGHPADPYKRIDIRRSTREIKVVVAGQTVAESTWAMHLYETSLPVRYYLPKTAAKWELVQPSETTSFCSYKGQASYYHIVIDGKVHEDLVWWYQTSPLEALTVQNMVSISHPIACGQN